MLSGVETTPVRVDGVNGSAPHHAAVFNLLIAQFDIKTAFLYGDIDVEIFMSQPEAFETNAGKVWRLKRSLYGLKQSPRQWFTNSDPFYLKLG